MDVVQQIQLGELSIFYIIDIDQEILGLTQYNIDQLETTSQKTKETRFILFITGGPACISRCVKKFVEDSGLIRIKKPNGHVVYEIHVTVVFLMCLTSIAFIKSHNTIYSFIYEVNIHFFVDLFRMFSFFKKINRLICHFDNK